MIDVSVSRGTVLRLDEALPDPEVPSTRVGGVDEYARKGRHYGLSWSTSGGGLKRQMYGRAGSPLLRKRVPLYS
ncbi:hypothetical protein ACFVWY_31760 [Streptomyces sp. NPDC058195]|uniref:hypothetical protein n=1 Tax=Streptomyces sp. NPDC058195 TaxID=3346375 RepID=UPI0036ED9D84